MRAREVFNGSNGDVTKKYYAELEELGPVGIVAMNLFRAAKCSARAKLYRGAAGGKWKANAYDRKNWSLGNLCKALMGNAKALQIPFGWKLDPETVGYEWVLYIDLPEGQASFHSPIRFDGPDYPGDWAGKRMSDQYICAFCDRVHGERRKPSFVDHHTDDGQTGPAPWEERA